MRPETSPTAAAATRLADYAPPAWLVDDVRLVFTLDPAATRVRAIVAFRRNPAVTGSHDLRLDGRGIKLIHARVNGKRVRRPAMERDAEGLTILAGSLPQDRFTWDCLTQIDPSSNTELEGLYLSRGMYCTQCEAEGFRKITYYPDRPDVLAPFSVRIVAPLDVPVLLSNGNSQIAQDFQRTAYGFDDGIHVAEWHDPHPKPAYLFALVAGDLVAHRDRFETMSGSGVDLAIWVRPGDEDRCAYAMDALKRSMRWDEEVYGREYDLDQFNIVAVDDFNMGAMENKGLNIFNARYVLASPQTATDQDYASIESIVAHEYFHNWTGNRITCRDWFQLCLKEGLTVFRDQQFTADQRSAAVERIGEVKALRARQFPEDQGPLAHPVRPEQYVEINNFYTATVYEKGAEVIRMLHLLVGPQGYRAALDLYFDRHDGQACTIEQFRACFEDATGRDLTQFALWWSQAGTPAVTVREDWDGEALTLTLSQRTPPTPGQPDKAPLVIPLAIGGLGADGREVLPTTVLELTEAEQSWRFALPERPVLSVNRGFSAPVIVEHGTSAPARALLLAADPDPFARWEAGHALALEIALEGVRGDGPVPDAWTAALGRTLADEGLDPAFRALALELPGEDEIARALAASGIPADPDRIHARREAMLARLGGDLAEALARTHAAMAGAGPYSPDAAAAGRRALRNRCLGLLAAAGPEGIAAAADQHDAADNMTDRMAALGVLVHRGAAEAEPRLEAFRERWRHDPLVLGKWLSVQATAPLPGTTARVEALTGAPEFEWRNPNRFRSLIGAYAMTNPVCFHAADGSGYRLFTDWLIRLDGVNPQTAARLTTALEGWRQYTPDRQALMQAALARIAETRDLSRNTAEMVSRIQGTEG